MSTYRPASVNAAIDTLGGTAATARLLGVSMQVVSHWRAANRFPRRTFLTYGAILRERGIDAPPSLWGLEEVRRASRIAEPAE